MPGYLIWLNARLYEMKRLLKKTGSLIVHCDWHASHYIKCELDKILGYDNFRNEIVWYYKRWTAASRNFQRMHDVLLWYSKTDNYKFNKQLQPHADSTLQVHGKRKRVNAFLPDGSMQTTYVEEETKGVSMHDVWEVKFIVAHSHERIGYPTQKPIELLQRVIDAASDPGDLVADFFCGGGSFALAAMGARVVRDPGLTSPTYTLRQELQRRWVACDQSRVALAITADRLARAGEQLMLDKVTVPIPDFTVEHWGVYEASRLAEMPPDQFRAFVLRCFGATPEPPSPQPSPGGRGGNGNGIHGMKGAVPVWVGDSNPRQGVTAQDVQHFANAIRKTLRYKQDNLRDGIMLGWAFRKDAVEAAERLRKLEQTDLNFIRLDQVRIDSPRFREHVAALTTKHADYETFLTFVQPPRVEVGYKRLKPRTYLFDVSETVVLNAGAKIINVQWDFDYGRRFSSTPGYSFVRGKKGDPTLQVEYEFAAPGSYSVACKVQDDMGGEGMWSGEVGVK